MLSRQIRIEVQEVGLSVSLWNVEGTDFLGCFEGVEWVRELTEVRGRSDHPWQVTSIVERLLVPLDAALQRLILSRAIKPFIVIFQDDVGRNFQGRVVYSNSVSEVAVFLGQGQIGETDSNN